MNPVKGEAPLTLNDGREYTLVLDFNAMVEAEAVYGKPLPKLLSDMNSGFIGAFRALLFGTLRRDYPDITAVEASDILMSDLAAVGTALSAVTAAAFPNAEGKKSGKVGPSGITKNSGPNGAKQGSTRKRSGTQPRAPSA